MQIANREIGPGLPPAVIAEIGANHCGSLERLLQTIEAAKRSGADFVKLQAYTANTITIDSNRDEFTIQGGPWKGKNLYQLYKSCETPFEWFPKAMTCAKELGIPLFASVFDSSSVDMLEKLGCPAYKIASFEIVDLPLIRYAAYTSKPVILSTGMASSYEVCQALKAIVDVGAHGQEPVVLHCVSGYPAKASDYSLSRLKSYSSFYGVSDHTLGLEVPIAATALGACMIEKHFRDYDCPSDSEDAQFSLSPEAFARMVKAVYETWAAMQPGTSKSEAIHKPYRRSLFVVRAMKRGEVFNYENVRSIRPGHGIPPGEIDKVLGLHASRDIERGEPLKLDMLEGR